MRLLAINPAAASATANTNHAAAHAPCSNARQALPAAKQAMVAIARKKYAIFAVRDTRTAPIGGPEAADLQPSAAPCAKDSTTG